MLAKVNEGGGDNINDLIGRGIAMLACIRLTRCGKPRGVSEGGGGVCEACNKIYRILCFWLVHFYCI